ncbi:MAG TPA: PqqD family protein [Xanthomonadales bacterium]|nr:PqqD family protein [Xanthomonadales bacterium]
MNTHDFDIQISENVISQEVLLGETLLLDTSSLAYFGLDELGSLIWREMNACSDASELYARVQSSADLNEQILARKFDGILSGLEAAGIISLTKQV